MTTTVKDDQVHKLREELNLRRKLETETEDFAKKAEKMESIKRKQEADAKTVKKELAGREKREQVSNVGRFFFLWGTVGAATVSMYA